MAQFGSSTAALHWGDFSGVTLPFARSSREKNQDMIGDGNSGEGKQLLPEAAAEPEALRRKHRPKTTRQVLNDAR